MSFAAPPNVMQISQVLHRSRNGGNPGASLMHMSDAQ
jgi:hypothetical protein